MHTRGKDALIYRHAYRDVCMDIGVHVHMFIFIGAYGTSYMGWPLSKVNMLCSSIHRHELASSQYDSPHLS